MDEMAYEKVLADRDVENEALCRRCGECCGVFCGDPCSNLEKLSDGRYSCKIYNTRHGLQKTVSGRAFMCISIRDVIKSGVSYRGCPYCKVA